MSGIRPRITYANVMSTIAVFIALGGSAFAVKTLKRNSVGPKQLKRNAVTNPKLADAAVNTAELADNAVDAAKVQNGSLGSAELTGALQAAFRVICPGSPATLYHEAVCIETAARTAANFSDARADCIDEGRSLPEYGDLARFRNRDGITLTGEWTTEQPATTHAYTVDDAGAVALQDITTVQPYRCVATPSQG